MRPGTTPVTITIGTLLSVTALLGATPGVMAPVTASGVTSSLAPVWSRVARAGHPPGLWEASAAYDPVAREVVLFGGVVNRSGTWSASNATWTFAAGAWSRVAPSVSPPARWAAYMAWDAHDGYLLLFGGCLAASTTSCAHPRNDTWAFSGGAWSLVHPKVSPEGRALGAAAYDPARGTVVLVGGTDSSGNDSKMWEYRAANWTPVIPRGTPGPGGRISAAYFPPNSELIYLGVGTPVLLGAAFRSGSWTPIPSSGGVNGPSGEPLSWDSRLREMVAISNQPGNMSLWGFNGTRWTNLTHGAQPTWQQGAAGAFDPRDGYLVLFGGEGNCGTVYRFAPCFLNQTWVLR